MSPGILERPGSPLAIDYPFGRGNGPLEEGGMQIPNEQECAELLAKYDTPVHIISHSRKVAQVGCLLGIGLVGQRDHPLNLALLGASCLLHDIGKYPCLVDGAGYHDIRGEEILQAEGYPAVARIVVQHVVLRGSKDDPIREEHIVFYADKRVVHDKVVSLEERFIYLAETYAKSNAAAEWLLRMKADCTRLEKRIFELLDFNPEDVPDLIG